MVEKLIKLGIKRKKGYLYYIDKQGDISCAKMARGKQKGGSPKKLTKCSIKRKKGYLYFLDKAGDVSCAKMVRRGWPPEKPSSKKYK